VSAYLKPGFVVSRLVNPPVMRLGLATTLAVRGRKSGAWRTAPVNVLELEGERYLVAPRGETQWVRNLRAAGGGELRRRSRSEAFTAVELFGDERRRAVEAYKQRWGSQVKAQFETLPNPDDHPVFRVATDR
jgi:deazaflavin-dependent oxidoreductase (nitroreductase family)